jgi:hypothetical protein
MLKIIWTKNFTLQWPWRLEILETKALKVLAGRKAFDAVGVPLVSPLEIPRTSARDR